MGLSLVSVLEWRQKDEFCLVGVTHRLKCQIHKANRCDPLYMASPQTKHGTISTIIKPIGFLANAVSVLCIKSYLMTYI